MFPELSEEFIEKRLALPAGKLKCVIDTDTYNEVDDQFAVAWALRSPERLDVLACYAAPYSHDLDPNIPEVAPLLQVVKYFPSYCLSPKQGMENSYNELLNLYSLLGEDPEGKVFRGSEKYIGKEGKPVDSDAARDLIKKAMAMPDDEPLYVIAIGAITNVASAILMEPEIIKKIVVVWLGGQPFHFKHGAEFNLVQDIPAVRVLYDCKVPLVVVPCMSVASSLTVTPSELNQYLNGKSKIGSYLSDIVISQLGGDAASAYMTSMFLQGSYLMGENDQPEETIKAFGPPAGTSNSRIIWDISTVGYVLNPNFALTKLVPSPTINDDSSWGPVDDSRHRIRVCTYLFRDLIFGDMFSKLDHD
ncbi:MAG: nucleoside hydrolase [Oscillospiraceae bacterium]|nr:nucleoside hydrolase [Oscillospiraceae bacterium]